MGGNEELYYMTDAVSVIGATGGTLYCAYANDIDVYMKGMKNNKGTSKTSDEIYNLANDIKKWIGNEGRAITNKNGDKVFISSDGTRRVRFDINNPSPHNSPHGHVEEFINGKWNKSGPLYPTDVPHK